MIKVGITGGNGFVGSHMRFYMHAKKTEFEVILIEKEDFFDDQVLISKISKCDILLHFAGLNRGDEEEIYNTNVGLTKKILSISENVEKKPKIIFLSSTHNNRDTAYGRSKKESEKIICDWGEKNNSETVSIIAPNIFGEFVKPNYNSFVATFCDDLINNKESQVNEMATVSLVYIGEICSIIMNMCGNPIENRQYLVSGDQFKVSQVYTLLKTYKEEYFSGIIPKFGSRFELSLFNTFRSYLYPNFFPFFVDVKKDERGYLFEAVKEKTGGQLFFSTTKIGVIRGGHYHTRKIERFCVILGEAIIKLRKLFSEEIIEYKVSGSSPCYVDIPTFYTHSIENVGEGELLAIFWVNEIFDPNNTDTFMEPISN